MEMTMRWFGKDYDTVTLEQIKQTSYATGIITTLYNKMPGEVWNLDEILAMKKEVEDAGLHLAGIESVNVSDAIKTGGAGRDHDIQAYIETLENLGKADIHMVCYNFMPVFDWTRTELDHVREDGSTVMAYNQDAIDKMDPEKMFDAIRSLFKFVPYEPMQNVTPLCLFGTISIIRFNFSCDEMILGRPNTLQPGSSG